jgi:integrase
MNFLFIARFAVPVPIVRTQYTISAHSDDILTGSKLLYGSSKIPRSSYCLRHTYATFRLMEGVDVYFLAKQMGTSVRMIEDHYGHITPSKNADLILQGIPGREPAKQGSAAGSEVSVNADGGGTLTARSRSPKR